MSSQPASPGAQEQAMKFLLHSHFPAGHAYPMQAIAQALVARGHDVVWLTSADNEARVRATAAAFVATQAIASVDAPLMRGNATGLFDARHDQLGRRMDAQAADYRAVLEGFRPHVLLVDVLPHGARALHELGEIPVYATLGVIPLYSSTANAPLPGSGECPPTSWFGVLVNAMRHALNRWAVFPLLLRPVINRQRVSLGLRGLPFGEPPEYFAYSPHLHIQASSRNLEFSQDPSSQQHRQHTAYVGPLVTRPAATSNALPAWWPEVVAHERVIGITQGTLAMDPTSLIIPSIEALRDEPGTLLVVVSPHVKDIESKVESPSNVRLAEWLPYHLLLPQLCLLITNGGYGSITQALSHKVPLLCAGQSEDKRDTAARVVWAGVGIDLKTDTPSPDQVRVAVRRILNDKGYKTRAKTLGDELNSLGGAERACDYLEELARTAATCF
ncbi:4'-demethylrebeccamycin synthase [Tolypocladium ophioglossoides CBS 100239]|uniref:4'-demethylrebeccamycin synthase n=1 Tax=Tolypocladium ophioglossoides (strain CBS 100239) TaxID=1163406 RepID=A0A0L0NG83_TOLOC|nr:4'-demethylrebeccamycin synthase [Tolypocladium ophioglossoides CBS 100239]